MHLVMIEKLIWKPWSHVQWRGPKTKQPFFKSVRSKKPHRIPFQFEMQSSQQLTGNVRYLPGCLLMVTHVARACATSDYLCFSISVTLYFQSCKDFAAEV